MTDKIHKYLILFLFLLSSVLCFAAEIPDEINAGVITKNLEYETEELSIEKEIPLIPETEISEDVSSPTSLLFDLKKVVFQGNTILSDKSLRKLVKKYENTQVTLKDLNDICSSITKVLNQKGFIFTKAYLPEQEIKEGIIQINIREITYDKIYVDGNSQYETQFILNNFNSLKEEPVNYTSLLKKLMIVNSYPDLKVRSFFEKSETPGTTDLLIKVEEENQFHVNIDYNNYGSRYVSRDKEKIGIGYSNLLFGGDDIELNVASGIPLDAMSYYQLDYSLPLNTAGTKLIMSGLYSTYQVGEDFEELEIEGDSTVYKINISQALIRTTKTNMDSYLMFDYSTVKNYMLGEETSQDDLRVGRFGVSYDVMDGLAGRNFLNVMYSSGFPDVLGGTSEDGELLSRNGASPKFNKINADITRMQRLPFYSILLLKASGQTSSDVLPSSEEISIGGIGSVRGYYQSKFVGDRGYNLSAELRFAPPFINNMKVPFLNNTWSEILQVKIFYDYGEVFLESLEDDQGNNISGFGYGFQFSFPKDISAGIEVGHPIDRDETEDASSVVYVRCNIKFY